MKNLSGLLFAIITVIGLGYLATSCNDKFSEEDLLKLQLQYGNEQDSLNAAKALEALNAAGEMVSFQVKVVDTDGEAVEGADVTLAAAADGGTVDNQTLTTDANGKVYFDKVVIGGNTMTISSADIIDATLALDFGEIESDKHYINVDGNIVPTPVVENAIITVLSTTTATATVKGNVMIETDVTNATSEVPQDLMLSANFNDQLVIEGSIPIVYFLSNNENLNGATIGSAIVDNTTGDYSMTVPAGVKFNVTIPNISAMQHIAVDRVNNIDLDRPEYRDVNANFGPNYSIFNYSSDYYDIRNINGVRIVFDQPAPSGNGFTLSGFEKVGRNLNMDVSSVGTVLTRKFVYNNAVYQFTTLGINYQSTPTVIITDPTGTTATAEAEIEFVTNSITVITPETGLSASSNYYINIAYTDMSDVDHNVVGFWVTSNASGEITQTEINDGFADAVSGNDNGFGTNWVQISSQTKGMKVIFPGSGNGDGVALVSINGRIMSLKMTNSGSDYTNPTFTFSGGGATTQAELETFAFGTAWTFNLDNSQASAYGALPKDIYFEYQSIGTTSFIYTTENSDDIREFIDGTLNTPLQLIGDNVLAINDSGQIVYQDLSTSVQYQTNFFSSVEPTVIVVEPQSIPASATLPYNLINENGGNILDGAVLSNVTYGSGYTYKFSASIEPSAIGAPGSGAILNLTGGNFGLDGTYNWGGGYEISSGGLGYLRDLNQVNGNSGNGNGYRNRSYPNTSVNLRKGELMIFNIDYGTGVRSVDFN